MNIKSGLFIIACVLSGGLWLFVFLEVLLLQGFHLSGSAPEYSLSDIVTAIGIAFLPVAQVWAGYGIIRLILWRFARKKKIAT